MSGAGEAHESPRASMQFLIIAHDHTDDEALVRRLVVRERHLAAARRTVESGNMLIGGAILDDEGRMVGSMSVVSFPDRATLDEWLQDMPYMKNNVWETVEIYPYHVAVAACPEAANEEHTRRHLAELNPGPSHGGEERKGGRYARERNASGDSVAGAHRK